jgi:hypothetical protein
MEFDDLVYRFRKGELSKTKFAKLIADNGYEKECDQAWGENRIECGFDMNYINAYLLKNNKFIDEQKYLEKTIRNVFEFAWDKRDSQLLKIILDRYPRIIETNNDYAINLHKYINDFKRDDWKFLECAKLLFHHIKYPDAIIIIRENFDICVDHIAPFIQYINSEVEFNKAFREFIYSINDIYYTDISNIYNDFIDMKRDIESEDFGMFMYANKRTWDKILERYPNISTVMNEFRRHRATNNYKFRLSARFIAIINRAIHMFDVKLISAIYTIICKSKRIKFTSAMLVYMYENKYINSICKDIMPEKMTLIYNARKSVVNLYADKYVGPNVAKIIANYVPYEIAYTPTNSTPLSEKKRLSNIGIDYISKPHA